MIYDDANKIYQYVRSLQKSSYDFYFIFLMKKIIKKIKYMIVNVCETMDK